MPERPPLHRPHPPSQQRSIRAAERQKFYQARAWRRFRKAFLEEHPLCKRCDDDGNVVIATEVHHVKDLTLRPDLALEPTNLEALCKPCHSQETARRQPKGEGGSKT